MLTYWHNIVTGLTGWINDRQTVGQIDRLLRKNPDWQNRKNRWHMTDRHYFDKTGGSPDFGKSLSSNFGVIK